MAEPFENKEAAIIDVTRVRFRLRKSLLYLVIPFRRVYLLTAVALNLSADLLAYVLTTNWLVVLAVGAVLEFVRRILKL